ncbi:pectinesterase inhibitor 10-like [Brachypodium distachyon]|uniref:Pectinesterase inhibitor domain-containing protein n=1 Tax=Brachypodium distachyon TaxID=15368 RepID=A0A2K2DHV0_BRADI|nr:pectinesterase inhibitor 10-like [Brachypodium distachyon]PNT73861.1 hypothetical protein BRADI_1g03105v3 [Brachypodium distachyon]|eukprot:XP_010229423.1 pectinesterase inhibitor 10-like [Brachypodium distachyon]
MPPPLTKPKPMTPPAPKTAPKPPVMPPPKTPSKPVIPPPKTPSKPVLPPPSKALVPPAPMPMAMPPVPWEGPGYESRPIPEQVQKVCRLTLFPDLCGRVLSFAVDPQRANDTRRLAEAAARAAISAGTTLVAFGYVNAAGAKNGTRLRMCVRDCTVLVDLSVKNLTASVAALKRGQKAEAAKMAGDAAKGFGICWGSCAKFTGEAMVVITKRAKELERLIMIVGSIILMII